MGYAGWFVLGLVGIVSCAALGADNYNDVKFYLYNVKNDTSGKEIQQNVSSILRAGWNTDVPTKVIICGWKNDLTSEMPVTVISAFLEAEDDYNVIGVDWTTYGSRPYLLSRLTVKGVGTSIANFLEFLVKQGLLTRQSLHIIGHSLGAHVAGNVGKAMAKTGDKIIRISGLDPAGPGFLAASKDRLSEDDAKVVDVIHTDVGGLGTTLTVGKVDFYPNGGKNQPGCSSSLLDADCNHGRSFRLFAASIRNRHAFSNATLIESSQHSTSSSSSRDSEDAQMGYWLQFVWRGSYYIETKADYPYY